MERNGDREAARPRAQELALTLLLGAAGAGLVFLATRQGWARVQTVPPKPLPASVVSVTGAALVPYADALVVAGLASLAAILATKRTLRRITGLLLAALGLALAASAFTLSAANAITAAGSGTSPVSAGAGSVTQGTGPATSAVPNVAGAAPHVTFVAAGWQVMLVAGAIAMVIAGGLVIYRADWLAVMSSRYDARSKPVTSGQVGSGADALWEALSRGDDPTKRSDTVNAD